MIRSHRAPSHRKLTLAAGSVVTALVLAVGVGAYAAVADDPAPPIACPAGQPIVLLPGDSGDSGTWQCTPLPTPSTVTLPGETVTVTAPPSTVTETTTVTVSASPTAPTSTTPAPTTTSPAPTTTAPPTTPPGPTLHGRDITAANTGWQAPGAPACASIRVFTSRVSASSLGSTSCVDLRGGINPNAAITLTSSRVVGPVGGDSARLTLNWVTVDGNNSGEYGVYHRVDCFRCNISGASDGVRFSGTNIVESWIRVRSTSSADHNDGIQAYQASDGGSILRSNISSRPVNNPSIYGTAPIFIADNSHGEVVIRDNYLIGGSSGLRLHESCTYRVTGNVIEAGSYHTRDAVDTTNAIPGAFLEWADNRLSTGQLLNR